jgi:2-hydroxy-3-keto-5-methylthiopentenyl-1-phosphate phosphatase
MRIGLFLDVDITLTVEPIQMAMATAIKCKPEYLRLEQKFSTAEISAVKFGDELIKLFAARNFTDEIAESVFPNVRLQPWAAELLSLGLDTYLVSSGPNYYIDRLAQEYHIPSENVCSSVYGFNKLSGVIESCKAADPASKDYFVSSRAGNYDVTIGIGDNPTLDSFVSHCTISLLTASRSNARDNTHILIPNFSAVIILIHKLLGEEIKISGQEARSDAQRVIAAEKYPNIAAPVAGDMTVGQFVSIMKLSQVWAVLVALVALVGGAFYLGQKLAEIGSSIRKSEIRIERNNAFDASSQFSLPLLKSSYPRLESPSLIPSQLAMESLIASSTQVGRVRRT